MVYILCVFAICTDGIVLGLSSLQQLDANLNACEEGHLTQGRIRMRLICLYIIVHANC